MKALLLPALNNRRRWCNMVMLLEDTFEEQLSSHDVIDIKVHVIEGDTHKDVTEDVMQDKYLTDNYTGRLVDIDVFVELVSATDYIDSTGLSHRVSRFLSSDPGNADRQVLTIKYEGDK